MVEEAAAVELTSVHPKSERDVFWSALMERVLQPDEYINGIIIEPYTLPGINKTMMFFGQPAYVITSGLELMEAQ